LGDEAAIFSAFCGSSAKFKGLREIEWGIQIDL